MTNKRLEIFLVLCLCVIAAVPFLPALRGGMTNWDDDVNVAANPFVRAGVRDGLLPLLVRPYLRLYVPLTYAVFWAGFHLWGVNPLGYHVVNLLCHLFSVVLVYLIFRRLLSWHWADSASDVRSSAPCWAALAASAWWGVHPLHVEPVAWVTGLKDVLSVMLVLLCWHLYIAGRNAGCEAAASRRRRLLLYSSLGAFLLACLAKPAVVTFPLVLAGCDLLAARPPSIVVRWTGRRVRELLPLMPFLAVSVAVAGLTLAIHRPEGADVDVGGVLARLRLAGDSALFYLGKIFWPSGLCPVYGRKVSDVLATPWSWVRMASACALFAAALLAGWRWKLGAIIFAAALAPVSGLVAFGYLAYSTVADRYAYLPSVGVAFVLGGLLLRFGPGIGRSPGWSKTLVAACMALWVAGLSVVTWNQTRVWRDSLAVWERVMAYNHHPPAPVLSNYGSALFRARHEDAPWRMDEALRVLKRCVQEAPGYVRGRYNLARTLHAIGRVEAARVEYLRALELDPSHVNAWVALGALEAARGDYGASARASVRALQLDSRNAMAALNLGLALLELDRPAEAAAAFQRAVSLQPDDKEVRFYLGVALRKAGLRQEMRKKSEPEED